MRHDTCVFQICDARDPRRLAEVIMVTRPGYIPVSLREQYKAWHGCQKVAIHLKLQEEIGP